MRRGKGHEQRGIGFGIREIMRKSRPFKRRMLEHVLVKSENIKI